MSGLQGLLINRLCLMPSWAFEAYQALATCLLTLGLTCDDFQILIALIPLKGL